MIVGAVTVRAVVVAGLMAVGGLGAVVAVVMVARLRLSVRVAPVVPPRMVPTGVSVSMALARIGAAHTCAKCEGGRTAQHGQKTQVHLSSLLGFRRFRRPHPSVPAVNR